MAIWFVRALAIGILAYAWGCPSETYREGDIELPE